MGRLFGTDGVRGLANRDVTAELALDLSVAAAHVLTKVGQGHRPTAVVGRDGRASGEFLQAAVVAGLASVGVDVIDVGVLPTPAIAYLVGQHDADLGVMLSASHNAMPDNGIKFFTRGGVKLDDDAEDAIEAALEESFVRPTGADVGRVREAHAEGLAAYVDHIVATAPHRLDGLRVVVDCANGASSQATPMALTRLGADVVAIHAEPNGLNINENCGSTYLGDLQGAVVAHQAHVGIAHDGDADRCLAVDAVGSVVDGDQILAILALAMHAEGSLVDDTVVVTVMSNEGFRVAMRRAGVHFIDTAVGDRYVLEAMRDGGYSLGGEQSGHVVMSANGTTGDGLMTATHVLAEMARTKRSLADLAGVVHRLPQVLINVGNVDKVRADSDVELLAAVASAEVQLGESGRVLLRSSGTESLVRVMVEAGTAADADAVAQSLAAVVRDRLAL